MRLLDPLRRAFRWHRRTFAALLVAVAVLAGLNALTSGPADGVAVVIATRGIAGGRSLVADDLRVARVPAAVAPEGAATDPEPLVGRTVVVDVPVRTVLTPGLLLESAGRARSGAVALPVRFAEAAAVSLVRVGSRLDVLGPVGEGAGFGVVAGDVRVLAVPAAGSGGLLDGGGAPLVLLEVTPQQAAAITAAATVAGLGFALR